MKEILRLVRRYGGNLLYFGDHLIKCSWYVLTERRAALSQNRFIIFGRGRSGSTALVSLLDKVQGLHCDGEILNRPVLFPHIHVHAKCALSKAKIYGCKILSYQVRSVQPIQHREQFIRCLFEEGFKIIYLRRENLVYHALSNIRARVYSYHKKITDRFSPKALTVDPKNVLRWIKGSEGLHKYEKVLLEGVFHLPLTYEQHIEDESQHQLTVDLICNFLGIESSKVTTEYSKVSPRTLRESVANYYELVRYLENTPYAKYLA